jgi:alpha-galactosidase
MYLSGHLNEMTAEQRAVVDTAVAAHREVLGVVASAVPVWPLGLPGWEDPWVALGLAVPGGDLYLTVWSLPGGPASVSIPLAGFIRREVTVTPFFPADLGSWEVSFEPSVGLLHVGDGGTSPTARVFRIRTEGADPER